MTNDQVALVKKSWSILRKVNPALIGDVFYSKLFLDEPKLKHLFRHPLKEQSEKFIDMLGFMISNVGEPEALTAEISRLALRHRQYGVQHIDYDAVGVAFLWTLQHGLGSDWNDAMKAAWTSCYATIAAAMKHAVAEAT